MDELRNNCPEVRENLAAYLDGELESSARRAVEEHLSGCAACRRYGEELKAAWRLLDELEAPAVSRGFTARVVACARADGAPGPLRRAWRAPAARWALSGLAASIAVGLFLFGVYASARPRGAEAALSPAEQECILYLDLLKDLNTLEHVEMVRSVERVDKDSELRDALERDGDEDWGLVEEEDAGV